MKRLFLLLLLYTYSSCNPSDRFTECNEDIASIKELYLEKKDDLGLAEVVGYDIRNHEFVFSISKNSYLCKIGYRSEPNVVTFTYDFMIIEIESGNVLFNGSSTFDSSNFSYYELPDPIKLSKNTDYKVIRTFPHNEPGLYSYGLIGPVIGGSNLTFPFGNDFLTIKSENLATDVGFPYINLVFSQ